jgi:hypothetical protein
MRHSLVAALLLASAPALAFEPGTHGEVLEEEGYVVGCVSGEGGGACEIHARGAVFMAYSEGPSEPEAMNALAGFAQGAPVRFTGDEISMGDVTVEFALNNVAANPDDPLAPLVADLQGDWKANGKTVYVTGLEWSEADGRAYLISFSNACSDGVDRGGLHLSLYEMGGDPFFSICLQLVTHSADQIALVNVETGEALTLDR